VVLLTILTDGASSGELKTPTSPRLPRSTRTDLKQVGKAFPAFAELPEALLAQGIAAWAQVFGLLSFELFGQLVGSVTDYDAFFDYQVRSITQRLGLQ
jgi:hypothetical protein